MNISFKKSALLAVAIVTALSNTSYTEAAPAADKIQTRDVVVTASRTEQEIKEAPAAVEVITAEDIKKMGATTLEQALQQAVGIDVLANGMVGNNVGIRGSQANQTLILVDGMRLRTENTNQTANNYELQRISMNNVERIEIVRGAVSSLYGADAMGGVINIITKTPDKEEYSITSDWSTKQSGIGFRASTGLIGKWATSFSYKHDKVNRRDIDESIPLYGRKKLF